MQKERASKINNYLKALKSHITVPAALALALIVGFAASGTWAEQAPDSGQTISSAKKLVKKGETHLSNIVQLTFGGENAEAYFSADASELILQSTKGGRNCDAIFRMNSDGSNMRMVSSGKGVTTCPYIAPNGKFITYASTHLGGAECPPKPDHSRGYVWALYKDYDIFAADPDGGNLRRLTNTPGYDAEGVFSTAGDKIIFTSARDGDLELYTMNPDGTEQTRITNSPGYDGGAFFSYDGKRIVWRASRPTGEKLEDYRQLLKEGLIRPSKLEIYIANTDGSDVKQLTANGQANFGPYWHPSGNSIIFASNMNDPKGRNFDLFTVDVNSKKTEQITFNETFDGFPMFSHDGKKLVFASNRNNGAPHETNVFIADWVQ